VLATREAFYVGGKYVGAPDAPVMVGQMYVEALTPAKTTQPYPMVLVHGNFQTATNWTGTPDGRPGWTDYFLRQGYRVYIVDQPARGRSGWRRAGNGALIGPTTTLIEQRFTATAISRLWPQATKHTQWPGPSEKKGRAGDPAFDAFFATQVESLADAVETQSLFQAAGVALLDRIGPAIVVTHSQSGSLGWLLGDARPTLVKGIVALEPSGPPFRNAVFDENSARTWGLTDIPLTYEPPAARSGDLKTVTQQVPDGADLVPCVRQADPPRQLVRLKGIPVLIVTAEASYHAVYDHCTAQFLTQAGVPNTFMRLEREGIRGNGHMLMLEMNHFEIAAAVQRWLAGHVK
jgi:pimeloyl-ACP methyl ester carboxylesterase